MTETEKAIEEFVKNSPLEQVKFLETAAELSKMTFQDFMEMILKRNPEDELKINLYATKDKKMVMTFINKSDKPFPDEVFMNGQTFYSVDCLCDQRLKPSHEFFTPTSEELKGMSRASIKAYKKGLVLFRPFGAKIKPKFSNIIMQKLNGHGKT